MLKDNITELALQQFPGIDACDSWCVICLTMQLLGSYISTIRGQHKYAKIKKNVHCIGGPWLEYRREVLNETTNDSLGNQK